MALDFERRLAQKMSRMCAGNVEWSSRASYKAVINWRHSNKINCPSNCGGDSRAHVR